MTERMGAALSSAWKAAPPAAAVALALSVAAFGTAPVIRSVLVLQPYISAGLGLAIVCYIVHRLLCCASQYNGTEKFGMGMTAAGMIMATPALWMTGTPFDGWSFNVARFGMALYIITGGLRRDRHDRLNRNQKAYALGFRDGRSAGKVNT